MALVPNNPFGNMSGKLGGMVFGKNLGGNNVRLVGSTIQPNTIAQFNVRDCFRHMAYQWRLLTDDQRNSWNAFSSETFRPLVPNRSGKYSGYQAFNSCYMAIYSFNFSIIATDMYMQNQLTPDSYLGLQIPLPQNAPLNPGSTNIKSTDTIFYPIVPQFTLMYDTNRIYCACWITNPSFPGLAQGQFINEFNNPFGFKVYSSDSGGFLGFKCKNMYSKLLGSTGLITLTDHTLLGNEEFEFSFDTTVQLQKSKYKYSTGRWIWLTPVTIDSYGQQKSLGHWCGQITHWSPE